MSLFRSLFRSVPVRIFIALCLILAQQAFAADLRCAMCGMPIPGDSKNHFQGTLNKSSDVKVHICSLACMKHSPKKFPDLTGTEIADFNHPGQFIPAAKAFFLLGSEKIKADLGDMVMPPWFGAFKTKKEAEAARKKYGDGKVVEGLAAAMKQGE